MTMRMALALLPASLCALDLTRAVVVTEGDMGPRERKAATVLTEEVARRSWVRWPIRKDAGGRPAIVLTVKGMGPREGYTLQTTGNVVRVEGHDQRGLLFGVGHVLRNMRISRDRVEVDPLNLTTVPKVGMRGHQLGYRPKTNSYDGWTLAQWDQYIRDLAIFGTNAIELIPPRSDDDDDSPHFPLSKMETMIGMSKICDDYGLDVWIWYPALDADYGQQKWVDFALKEWEEVFKRLPRIDAVFVPGGDPGHTHPQHLMPLLEKQTASLRKYHPKAQMWVAPQGFSTEWLESFYQILRTAPTWLHGVVFGPQVRVSLADLRAKVPKRYPIRHYPDITHSLRCQYAVRDWDSAYQLTLQREPINPRPLDMAAIFHHTNRDTVGFITYSEGCNDDVNKIVWSGLGWDPDVRPLEILRDYSRYFIGHQFADSFAQGLLALERNWQGPLVTNESVPLTLRQFQDMDHAAGPATLGNWRFQQAQYRAHYDAYDRSRLLYETSLEHQAMDRLRAARSAGASKAIGQAEEVLDRAVTSPIAGSTRSRVFELAEALFQSIRMQLSVPWYKAIAVGRGANLDLIDVPLNNRPWLKHRFEKIRAMGSEKERIAAIDEILHWTNPGPGGFYDDLGNPSAQPHLVAGLPFDKDPDHLRSPLSATHMRTSTEDPWRMSWLTVAESRNDEPLLMRYAGLDPAARYRLRVVYSGEDSPYDFWLLADGKLTVHDYQPKPKPVRPVEFEVPAAATADGALELRFERRPGMGGAGRAVQVGEVWLVRNQ